MQRREMTSAREFAKFVDVSPTTITRAIDEREPTIPGIDFLIKLSMATKVSISDLVEMAYPDIAMSTRPSASSRVLAQQIEQLPDPVREVVSAIIRGSRVQRVQVE
jgi:hypothetical protein